MPPNNPPTPEQFASLASSMMKLADGCLALAQTNKSQARANELTAAELRQTREALAAYVEARDKDYQALVTAREKDHERFYGALEKINIGVAGAVDNIKDVQTDLHTNPHLRLPGADLEPHRGRGPIASAIDAYGRLTTRAQVLLVVLASVAGGTAVLAALAWVLAHASAHGGG